jgi:hypothetical protein
MSFEEELTHNLHNLIFQTKKTIFPISVPLTIALEFCDCEKF